VAELGADTVAAFFCEPIQGSGGVIVPPKGWLKAMRDAAAELDILLRGRRSHHRFRPHRPDVRLRCRRRRAGPDDPGQGPDLGYAPMGATMMSEKVYAGIADGAPAGVAVGHGATYSAHPVGAAVALEVLRLYEEGGVLANGHRGAAHFAAGLEALRSHPLVGDARYRGLLGALELVSNKTTKAGFDPALGLSERIAAAAYRNGVVFRAFADNILGFAPALIFSEDEFAQLFERLKRTLDDVLAAPEVRAALTA
jgi:4-aminobutyrate--pyruvate transaminase